MRALIVYDGSIQAKDALRYGLKLVKEKGGDIILLSVFNSPLFIGYDAILGAVEMARRELEGYIEDARTIIRVEGDGIRTRIVMGEGDPEEEILNYLTERYIDILICPPRYRFIIKRYNRILKEKGRTIAEDTITKGITAVAIRTV